VTSDAALCEELAEPGEVFACALAAAVGASSTEVCQPTLNVSAEEARCTRQAQSKDVCAIWRSDGASVYSPRRINADEVQPYRSTERRPRRSRETASRRDS
jgi:hypothetical protein